MRLATKTLQAIEDELVRTQGGTYREALGKVIMDSPDAYRGTEESSHRGHLGCSQLGSECDRALWYNFHWVKESKFEGRILRLFNRGHLEEPRFLAMLMSIGCTIKQVDENGKQFRVSHGAFIGGSGDGIALGIPDVPDGCWVLLEFKTHGDKSFKKLIKSGLQSAKPEHYVQMLLYMLKMDLPYGLYMAVNKNDDMLHAEIIERNDLMAQHYFERGMRIVHNRIPHRISSDSDSFTCKYCSFLDVCHYNAPKDITCRTCAYASPHEDLETWVCNKYMAKLSKERQLKACPTYTAMLMA